MIDWKTVFGIAGFVLLGACASSGEKSSSQAPVPAATQNLIKTVPPQGLPPQRLEPGQCGMFLWGQSTPRRFIFFAEAGSGKGLMLIDDKPADIWRRGASGRIFGEFNTTTEYQTADGDKSVNVSVIPGEVLEDGQRIESGRIVLTDREGWETILPVLGVRACIPG